MSRALAWLAGLGVVQLALVVLGATAGKPGWFGNLPRADMELYVGAAIAGGLVYAAAVWLVRRRGALRPEVRPELRPELRHGLAVVLVVAAAMRAVTFVTPPLLSTDIFRYVWDGRVQAAGINPYLYVPAAPELAPVRDGGDGWSAVFAHINRAESATTIYPPAAQALFALVARLWSGIWGIKATMLLFDLVAGASVLLLLRRAGQPAVLALIYLWNPLVVWEFAGGGHVDAAATGLSALALLLAVGLRPAWAAAALALAVLCKLLPAALFPALWRRWQWRGPAAAAAVIALGYAAYAGAGWRVLGYLPGYASEEGVGGHGAFLLRLLAAFMPVPGWATGAYAAGALLLLLGLAALVGLQPPLPANAAARARVVCRDALLLGTAVAMVLSPHYPWYLASLALPAVLVPVPAVLWLTIAAPILYLDDWHDNVIWPSLLFLPFAVLLVVDVLRARRQPALAVEGSR